MRSPRQFLRTLYLRTRTRTRTCIPKTSIPRTMTRTWGPRTRTRTCKMVLEDSRGQGLCSSITTLKINEQQTYFMMNKVWTARGRLRTKHFNSHDLQSLTSWYQQQLTGTELHFGQTMTLTARDEGQTLASLHSQWAVGLVSHTTLNPCAGDTDPKQLHSDYM